jgi:hypothetical protein
MGYRTLRKGFSILQAEGGVKGLCHVHDEPEAEEVRSHAFTSALSTITRSPSHVRPSTDVSGLSVETEPSAAVEIEMGEAAAALAAKSAEAGKEPIQYVKAKPVDDMDIDYLGPPVPHFGAHKSTLAVIGSYFSPVKVGLLATMFCGVVALTIARGVMARTGCGSLGY